MSLIIFRHHICDIPYLGTFLNLFPFIYSRNNLAVRYDASYSFHKYNLRIKVPVLDVYFRISQPCKGFDRYHSALFYGKNGCSLGAIQINPRMPIIWA